MSAFARLGKSRLNPWRDLAGLPRESWILALTSLVNRAGTMALPFLALYLTKTLHFTAARAGLVLGIYGLVALIWAPLSGRLSDRIGALKLMRGSLLSS